MPVNRMSDDSPRFEMISDFDLLSLADVAKLLHCSKAHVGKVVSGLVLDETRSVEGTRMLPVLDPKLGRIQITECVLTVKPRRL